MTISERLTQSTGILAALVRAGDTTDFAGEPAWQVVLEKVLELRAAAGVPYLRVAIGAHTVASAEDAGHAMAVIVPVGHPVLKSLRRLMRRQVGREQRRRAPKASNQAAGDDGGQP